MTAKILQKTAALLFFGALAASMSQPVSARFDFFSQYNCTNDYQDPSGFGGSCSPDDPEACEDGTFLNDLLNACGFYCSLVNYNQTGVDITCGYTCSCVIPD